MGTYVERYHQNREGTWSWHQEARTVWAELVSHGAAIREEPLYSEAKAVAQAMMTRARQNVELLVPRLQELGYRFADPEWVWVPPDATTPTKLDALEHAYGPLPLVVRTWFEVVGSVDFMGAHPKLSSYAEWGQDGFADLGCCSDPLVVAAVMVDEGKLLPYNDNDWYELVDNDWYELILAPDAIHKARYSGGTPLIVLVPNAAFDSPLIDGDNRWIGTFFIPYLQSCFEWGGFPGLKGHPAVDDAKAELAFLTKDLLPLW